MRRLARRKADHELGVAGARPALGLIVAGSVLGPAQADRLTARVFAGEGWHAMDDALSRSDRRIREVGCRLCGRVQISRRVECWQQVGPF